HCEDGPDDWFINVVGIALSRRALGGALADALLEDMQAEIAGRVIGSGLQQVKLFCKIHRENHPSKRLFRRHGFTYSFDEGEYEAWIATKNLDT
ncbi:MAG: hypothetical protein ACJ72Y_06195, partial [Actinomycetes bacterium]